MACPPSAKLEHKIPGKNNFSASEGTLAHSFGELRLNFEAGNITEDQLNDKLADLRTDELYTSEMETQVAKYTDFVMDTLREMQATDGEAHILIENKFDLSQSGLDSNGLVDAVVYSPVRVAIIDLKYGFMKVDAPLNPQLRIYALAVLHELGLLYEFEKVSVFIVQPRLDHLSEQALTPEQLTGWAWDTLIPAAEKANAGLGEYTPGEHCRYCKVKPDCRAYSDMVVNTAFRTFKDPNLLTDSELVDNFSKLGVISMWVKGLKEFMLKEAENGRKWPTLKLVAGAGKRQWSNPQEVADRMALFFEPEEYLNVKTKSIGDIEQLLSVDGFTDLLSDLVIKPAGAPKLVDESDPRPAFGLASAREAFGDL